MTICRLTTWSVASSTAATSMLAVTCEFHRQAVGERQPAGFASSRGVGLRRFPETALVGRVAGERLTANEFID